MTNEKETKECACRHSESIKAHVASIMPNDDKNEESYEGQAKKGSQRLIAEGPRALVYRRPVERKAVHLKTLNRHLAVF